MNKINYLDANLHQQLKLWPDNAYFAPMFEHLPESAVGLIKIAPQQIQQKHFHKAGADIFFVTEGKGVLHLGDVCSESGKLLTEQQQNLSAGDVYFVAPLQMHALENTSQEQDLCVLNIAPASHGNEDSYPVLG